MHGEKGREKGREGEKEIHQHAHTLILEIMCEGRNTLMNQQQSEEDSKIVYLMLQCHLSVPHPSLY